MAELLLILPAINWVDIPKWRVQKHNIRDDNISGMHELQKMWPCKTK